jgi:hypothetical protein
MALSNLVSIGGVEFTDDGRTYSEERDERAIPVELASGKIIKYIKAEKRTFQIGWTHLPQTSTYTSDQKGARNQLRPICYTGNTTTIIVRNAIGGSETYTVFVENYSETLLRRDPITGNLLYDVSISLREQ